MKRRSSYKVTFFDKHGPSGVVRLQAIQLAAKAFGAGILMAGALGHLKFGLSGLPFILFTLLGGLTLGGIAMFVGLQMGNAAGEVASRVYMGGNTTPYEDQFSEEQAKVMQRDYAGALELFEHKIAERAGDARVRIAAADLYATHGENPRRAAELYKEVQRIPELKGGQDIYVSNKLADLYLGALKEPGRALVEFRRLIHRYPDSTAAKHARMALANLKPDVIRDGQAPS